MKRDVYMEGGCLCGRIRYRLDPPVLFVSQCCCPDCRKATGTGHSTMLAVPINQLALTGEPKSYASVGESGLEVKRHFCGDCGGRLYTSPAITDGIVMIQAGSLDEPGGVHPQMVIYVKDALPWDRLDPGLPSYERLPPLDSAPSARASTK